MDRHWHGSHIEYACRYRGALCKKKYYSCRLAMYLRCVIYGYFLHRDFLHALEQKSFPHGCRQLFFILSPAAAYCRLPRCNIFQGKNNCLFPARRILYYLRYGDQFAFSECKASITQAIITGHQIESILPHS